MTKKRHTPERIVTLLRQVEVAVGIGKATPQACKEAAITEQTYYRWRKEYGGLKLAQAKRLKELERETSRLKRVVAELSLEKHILREVAQGNSVAPSGGGRQSSRCGTLTASRSGTRVGCSVSGAVRNAIDRRIAPTKRR